MPYTSPAAQSSGGVAPVSWATAVTAALDYLADPPSCRVFHNATQAVPDAAFLNPVLFNSESHDHGAMHDTVTNTGRITITDAGVYAVSFTCQLAAAADYLYVQAGITANVAGLLGGVTVQGNAASYEPWLTVTPPPAKLTAGDYLTVAVFQDNGANVARNIKANTCIFGATWIGLG